MTRLSASEANDIPAQCGEPSLGEQFGSLKHEQVKRLLADRDVMGRTDRLNNDVFASILKNWRHRREITLIHLVRPLRNIERFGTRQLTKVNGKPYRPTAPSVRPTAVTFPTLVAA